MKLKYLILNILSLTLLFMSCQQKQKVDMIVIAKGIYTVDSLNTMVEAIAIEDGKIVALGSRDEVLKNYQAIETHQYDSSYIFPGFIDAHCHFLGYGTNLIRYADLSGTKSFDEVIDRLRIHDSLHTNNQWVLGRGWDQNDWEVKEFPNRAKLDSLWPNKPVMLIRIDGHAVLANETALKLANFSPETTIDGGELLTTNGLLTGVLIDNAADSIKNLVPKLNKSQLTDALMIAQQNCFQVGLTTVVDAGLEHFQIEAIKSAYETGNLKMNIFAMLSPTSENIENYINKGVYRTSKFHIGAIKLYADGALGSRGACLIEPYSDAPHSHGLIITKPEEMARWTRIAMESGYQLNTHAIGDSGVRMVLKAYANALQNPNDKRWRIEHSQVVHPSDFDYFGKYNIIPAVNTTHATSDMYWAGERLGEERLKSAYAYRNLLIQNGWLTNGSDFPIESINPILGFYAAVARQDLSGYPESGFQIENARSRLEALKAMTIWAAKGSFQETEKGSLEVGKNADIVVIDKNLLEAPLNSIPQTKVLMTMVQGEIVYQTR